METHYKNGFGKEFSITPVAAIPPRGDYCEFRVRVIPLLEGNPISENSAVFDIRCSSTLQRMANIGVHNIEAIAIQKTLQELENEKIDFDLQQAPFKIDLSSNDFIAGKDFLTTLKDLTEKDKLRHGKASENVRNSFQESSNKISGIAREHSQYQGGNAQETRTWLLQLASIGSAEAAALATIAPAGIRESFFAPYAIVLLVGTVILSLTHVIEILQNDSLKVFRSYKTILHILDKQRAYALSFIADPSLPSLKEWEELIRSPADIKSLKSMEIRRMEKDLVLYLCGLFFTAANLALACTLLQGRLTPLSILTGVKFIVGNW